MVLFGGWSSVYYDSMNDTWLFDLQTHEWRKANTTGTLPPRRGGHVAVYDRKRHRMIVVAGSNWWQTWYNDAWALDLASLQWSKIAISGSPPVARFAHCGVYDPKQDSVVIFGGQCGSTQNHWLTNEVWSLDLTTTTWTKANVPGIAPSARETATAVLDESNRQMLVFGGSGQNVWSFNLDTQTWVMRSPIVSGRWHHAAVFDPSNRDLVIVGGYGGPSFCDASVYSVDNDQWLSSQAATIPPALRSRPAVVLDPTDNRIVMFGGELSLRTDFDDTWELRHNPYRLSLTANASSLSATTGGLIDFALSAGMKEAGRNYILAGTASGTAPGTPLPGNQEVIPINVDAFTFATLWLSNSSAFWNFSNILDGRGHSVAQYNTLGPLPSSAVGLRLHFAGTLYPPWDAASNAVSVEIQQ